MQVSQEKMDTSKVKKINNNRCPRDFEILGWCPVGTFLPHGEKVPL